MMLTPEVFEKTIKHGEHTYLLRWTAATIEQAVRVPGRQAVDPELNFDLYDGLRLATAIRDSTTHDGSKFLGLEKASTTR